MHMLSMPLLHLQRHTRKKEMAEHLLETWAFKDEKSFFQQKLKKELKKKYYWNNVDPGWRFQDSFKRTDAMKMKNLPYVYFVFLLRGFCFQREKKNLNYDLQT